MLVIGPFKKRSSFSGASKSTGPRGAQVVFQTGYGPSGLPHIGTIGEVVRTAMVRNAFKTLTKDFSTRLVCFADDMDGLRAVPDGIPNPELLKKHIGFPLSRVPNPYPYPYDEHPSFAAGNTAQFKEFLTLLEVKDYDLVSATECYEKGQFDELLLKVLENHDEIVEVVRPVLGEERKKTYSPFLPICPKTGKVLQARILETSSESLIYEHPETGESVETNVTGGAVKLQWRADWAARWVAFGVDYEIMGKDLRDSSRLAKKICKILGGTPPQGFIYELFLGADGSKISKSKGNALSTIQQWLRYGHPASLSLFMFQKPKTAKKLHFDVIPRTVDEYLKLLKEHYDEAIKKYDEAVERNPQNPEAYFNRGNAWFLKGEYDKAIADFTEAIALNPQDVAAYHDRGSAWAQKGEYEEAIADYNKAIELEPQNPQIYTNRGTVWFKKSLRAPWITEGGKAMEVHKIEDLKGIEVKEIEAYKKAIENHNKAIEDYNKAIELNPQDVAKPTSIAATRGQRRANTIRRLKTTTRRLSWNRNLP